MTGFGAVGLKKWIGIAGIMVGLLVTTIPAGTQALDYDFIITGTVYNEDEQPVPYATVYCHKLGTNDSMNTTTNAQGEYEFNLASLPNDYDQDDQFEIYTTEEFAYAAILGPSPYYGLQTGVVGVSIWGPIIVDGVWAGNHAMSYRTTDDAHRFYIQSNPYTIDNPWWTFVAGYTITDYNPYMEQLTCGVTVTWSASHGQNYVQDSVPIIYWVNSGNSFSTSGWLSILLGSGDFDGWTTFTFSIIGSWSAGGNRGNINLQWSHIVNLDWT